MTHYSATALGLIVLAATASCSVDTGAAAAEETTTDMIPFQGKVVWMDLEGGFWAIETQQGKHLLPTSLPEQFKQNDLPIKGKFRLLKDMMTIQMWGTPVEVGDLAPLQDSSR